MGEGWKTLHFLVQKCLKMWNSNKSVLIVGNLRKIWKKTYIVWHWFNLFTYWRNNNDCLQFTENWRFSFRQIWGKSLNSDLQFLRVQTHIYINMTQAYIALFWDNYKISSVWVFLGSFWIVLIWWHQGSFSILFSHFGFLPVFGLFLLLFLWPLLSLVYMKSLDDNFRYNSCVEYGSVWQRLKDMNKVFSRYKLVNLVSSQKKAIIKTQLSDWNIIK